MRKLMILAVMALMLLATAVAQDNSDSPAFVETVRFGRGDILHAEWHPDGDRFLVDTVRGAWIYGYSPTSNRFADLAYFDNARAARYSPNGGTFAAILPDNSLGVWDAYNHIPAESPTFPIVHDTEIVSIAWNPQSTHIASVDVDGRLLVWDVEARELAFAPDIENVWNYAWSTAGTYLGAIDSETYELFVWDTEGTPTFETTIERETFRLSANSLLWRNDSEVYQYAWQDMTTGTVWDVITGEPVQQFTPYGSTIDLSYSPDGMRLATGGYGAAIVYEANSRERLFEVETGWSFVSWSPDSSKLAVGDTFIPGSYGSFPLMIVDVTTGEILQEHPLHDARAFAWHPDNEIYLVVDGANEIRIYVEGSQFPERSSEHTYIGETLAWHDDGNLILATNTYTGSQLWDANTGDLLYGIMNQAKAATSIAWQPGGSLVATFTNSGSISISYGGNVYVWGYQEITTDELSPTITHTMELIMVIPQYREATGIAWSPDGSTLAIAEQGLYIRLWQPENPSIIRVLDYNRAYGMAYGIEWSTDGRSVSIPFSSSGNGGVVLSYDVESGERTNHTARRYASDWVWTPDNRLIWANWASFGARVAPPTHITLGGDGFSSDEQSLSTLNGLSERVTNGVFSPSGALLIGMDVANNAIIWDVETQQPLTELDSDQIPARDALWSPDESLLAISNPLGDQYIVDVASGEVLFTFPRHRAGMVYWSWDSQQIALLSQGVVFIYDRQ